MLLDLSISLAIILKHYFYKERTAKTMIKKKVISFIMLIMMMSVFTLPIRAAEPDFSDSFDINLSIGMDSGTAIGIANVKKLENAAEDTCSMDLALAFYDESGRMCGVKASEEPFTVTKNEDKLEITAPIPDVADTIKLFALKSLSSPVPLCEPVSRSTDTSLKVLAIGNSFSDDAMEYLYQIARAAGYEDITLGNMYIGGCTLNTHWNNAKNNSASYDYRKNTSGTWSTRNSTTMLYGIQDEDWDIITLQQASGSSGMPDTYGNLQNLIDYVEKNKTNPNAKLGWHMTWAYQGNSNHAEFYKYGNSQTQMYNAIVSTVKEKVIPTEAFDFIIPSGTAIQNTRTSFIGDTLTRDGYHLAIPFGRYIAGLTWLETLTGVKADAVDWYPDANVDTIRLEAVFEAVNNACENPFEVTPSSYEEYPRVNFDDYTLLDMDLTPYAYWYSTEGTALHHAVGDSFHSNYIATKKFTKDEIPNGSLIVVDSGWQYRPEGWQTEDSKNTSARPGNVSESIITVTDAWWGDYTLRAFNISQNPQTDISSKVDEAKEHFRIYIPKN